MSKYVKNERGVYVKPESDYHLFDWAKKSHIDNFANFSGRARRSEYWYTILADIIIQFSIIYCLDIIRISCFYSRYSNDSEKIT